MDMKQKADEIFGDINNLHEYRSKLTLNTSQTSRLIGTSVSTLEKWRREGVGIEYIKVSGRIMYTKRAIAEFLANNEIKTA